MRQFFLFGLVVAFVPMVLSAESLPTMVPTTPPPTVTPPPVVLQDPGLAPSDFFYFLDMWSEDLDRLLTFREESKARLAIAHAQERAAEVREMLDSKGAVSPEVKKAKDGFDEELARAATVITATGKTDTTNELYAGFESSKELLKDVYEMHRANLRTAQAELKKSIQVEKARSNTVAIKDLESKLTKLEEEEDLILEDDDSLDEDFKDETDSVEKTVGLEHSILVRIGNLERERDHVVQKLSLQAISPVLLADFNQTLSDAKTALNIKEFVLAKELLNDAKKVLNNINDTELDKDEDEDSSKIDKNERDRESKEAVGGKETETEDDVDQNDDENDDVSVDFDDDLDQKINDLD